MKQTVRVMKSNFTKSFTYRDFIKKVTLRGLILKPYLSPHALMTLFTLEDLSGMQDVRILKVIQPMTLSVRVKT